MARQRFIMLHDDEAIRCGYYDAFEPGDEARWSIFDRQSDAGFVELVTIAGSRREAALTLRLIRSVRRKETT